MKVFSYLEDAASVLTSSVVALGNFDGLHKGHQQLICEAVRLSKEQGVPAVIFTFRNHPTNEIAGKTVVKKIMEIGEKAAVAQRLGVDYMANIRFNSFIMKLEPEEFVRKVLVKSLKAKHVVCGFNYSFGYKGAGTSVTLQELGKKYGFGVTVIPEFTIDGQTVSSTYIRGLIEKGDMQSYIRFTGRTYKLGGLVIQGQHFGRTMGFPTANLNLKSSLALPCNGVYITKTRVNNQVYASVTNVGNKPTVGEFDKNAESHIFDYSGDLYGQRVMVEFVDMLRPEQKFDSIDALAAQIQKDCIAAKKYFETNPDILKQPL